jgi:Uncharacterized conserved protein
MPLQLQITLIVVSVLAILYVVRKIRHSKMNISDSIFWIVFAILMILIAVFPVIIFFLASLLGIHSPNNFLFLLVIAILLLKIFLMSIKVSQLQDKLSELVQKSAILKFDQEKKDDGPSDK